MRSYVIDNISEIGCWTADHFPENGDDPVVVKLNEITYRIKVNNENAYTVTPERWSLRNFAASIGDFFDCSIVPKCRPPECEIEDAVSRRATELNIGNGKRSVSDCVRRFTEVINWDGEGNPLYDIPLNKGDTQAVSPAPCDPAKRIGLLSPDQLQLALEVPLVFFTPEELDDDDAIKNRVLDRMLEPGSFYPAGIAYALEHRISPTNAEALDSITDLKAVLEAAVKRGFVTATLELLARGAGAGQRTSVEMHSAPKHAPENLEPYQLLADPARLAIKARRSLSIINQPDRGGNTVSHLIAKMDPTNLRKGVLRNRILAIVTSPGVDLMRKNKQGKTPLDLAKDNKKDKAQYIYLSLKSAQDWFLQRRLGDNLPGTDAEVIRAMNQLIPQAPKRN